MRAKLAEWLSALAARLSVIAAAHRERAERVRANATK